jgi:hypothetical protein
VTTHGVLFPETAHGERPTTAVAREVVADALRSVDPVGADAAERETAWRGRYLLHFRRLVEAGLPTPDAWCATDPGSGSWARWRSAGPASR